MKILVFGATGPTGKLIISQGLDLGYKMTAFVRDPEKLPIKHTNLAIITGNVLDREKVLSAVQGHDVILSALGTGKSLKGTVFSEGTKNIVDGMKNSLCRRVIIMSAYGVGDSKNNAPILLKMIYNSILKNIFDDKALGERYLKQSNLDWTLVHPVILTNKPKTGSYRKGELISISGIPVISRADVAELMLSLANDRTSIRRTIVISN